MTKKLSDCTLPELYAQKKKIKGILIGFGIVMLIACFIIVAVAIKIKNYGLLAACGGLISLLPLSTRLSLIEKEIKNREQDTSKI